MISFELFGSDRRLPADFWLETVPGTDRVEVELGPGDGRFLVESARDHPTTVYVGLEIRSGLAGHLAAADAPRNALFYHTDGRWVVCHVLADRSIDAFHIYFPDPWWKKRHAKRRLFTDEFCAALARCLAPAGRVFVITDVETLFTDICTGMSAVGLVRVDWERAADSEAQSSYERKYRRQGRKLYQSAFVAG